MKARNLATKLDKFEAAYRPGLGKFVITVILVLIWFFLGWVAFSLFWDFYKAQLAAVIVGLVVLISGLLFIISSYQKVGRQAQMRDWPELEAAHCRAKGRSLEGSPGSCLLSWAENQ